MHGLISYHFDGKLKNTVINLRDGEGKFSGAQMEAPPLIREDEDHFDGHLLHPPFCSTEGSVGVVDLHKFTGEVTSESRNAKRKLENGYGLFCVLRKRTCRQSSDGDMFPDCDNAEKDGDDDDEENCIRSECDFRFENLFDEDCCCSGSDTYLSDSSEFDVISEHVLQELDWMGELTGSKSLPLCNFPWPIEDEGTLVSNLSSETQNSILLLSLGEGNEDNGVRSKEDEMFSSVSVSPEEFQKIIDPKKCSGYSNDMSYVPGICEDSLKCSINKDDREVPCSSDVFKNDGDTSSAIEVRLGDVVSLQGSLEKMSSTYDKRLWNEDDEPIPISIVPPDGESSILPETCSRHQIVECINEYNVHNDNIGLELSPIHLTKPLERRSMPLSVCGSVAAARNIPLLENSSGACNSLDEQLHPNLNNPKNGDAELAQAPLTLYQEDVDDEDEICFSDIDAMIRKLNLLPDDSESCLNMEELNMSKHQRHTLFGLEHCTRTSIRRAIMSQGALAVLQCRDSKHFIRKREVIIGRSSDGLNVDIDLGKDGYGSKISRRQALVKLENNGSFSLKNLGKRHILVNGENLNTGQTVSLALCTSVDIRGIVFMFKINKEAVRQFSKNNTRINIIDDTKFRWCE